jgi:protein TonB
VNVTATRWAKLRERGGGVLFALFFNLLMLLALFTLAPKLPQQRADERNPVTFEMAPSQKASKDTSKAKKAQTRERAQEAPKKQTESVVRPQPVRKPAEQPPSPFPFMTLNSQQMASADIGKMAKKDSGAGQGSGDSAGAQGPGEGPGGVQLFPADWYRRPSDAELSPFLPGNAPGNGWGEVACKTVDHYHVENCQTLGESPLGSGFARAVRLAAWQFLVIPPRVNGKQQVGAWVRIRIDYTRTLVRDEGAAGPSGG